MTNHGLRERGFSLMWFSQKKGQYYALNSMQKIVVGETFEKTLRKEPILDYFGCILLREP